MSKFIDDPKVRAAQFREWLHQLAATDSVPGLWECWCASRNSLLEGAAAPAALLEVPDGYLLVSKEALKDKLMDWFPYKAYLAEAFVKQLSHTSSTIPRKALK